MNIDTFIPYIAAIDGLAALIIPVNLALQDSGRSERAKKFVLLAYMGAIGMMCVMGMSKDDGFEKIAFVMMELCVTATLPTTVWRIWTSRG